MPGISSACFRLLCTRDRNMFFLSVVDSSCIASIKKYRLLPTRRKISTPSETCYIYLSYVFILILNKYLMSSTWKKDRMSWTFFIRKYLAYHIWFLEYWFLIWHISGIEYLWLGSTYHSLIGREDLSDHQKMHDILRNPKYRFYVLIHNVIRLAYQSSISIRYCAQNLM